MADAVTKVMFDLDCVDGFPPIQFEMLNAEPLSDDRYRLKNTPFFVEGVAYDDVVVAIESDDAGKLIFLLVEERSIYTSLSIVIFDDSIGEELKKIFDGHGCVMEYGEFGIVHVFAVAVPIHAPYTKMREQLQALEAEEKISFAELALVESDKTAAMPGVSIGSGYFPSAARDIRAAPNTTAGDGHAKARCACGPASERVGISYAGSRS
jgi:hypothetical protein